jgi:hypothetical protein
MKKVKNKRKWEKKMHIYTYTKGILGHINYTINFSLYKNGRAYI